MVDFPALPPFPTSSFETPVPVPGVDPDTGDFISVCFNTGWLPYVIGCLKQLNNAATWDAADSTEMALVLAQSATLIGLFSEGCPMLLAGLVMEFAGDTAPDGWLFCDGSAVSRETYAVLFGVIGTTYGVGDTTTTFNLPDMRGRVPVGVGQQTGGTDFVLADTGGEETHVLTSDELASHTHVDAGHAHSEITAVTTVINGGLEAPAASAFPGTGVTGSASADIGSTGDDQPHNNMQPFLVLNYVIKF
jgi:microcystin-dependent protein